MIDIHLGGVHATPLRWQGPSERVLREGEELELLQPMVTGPRGGQCARQPAATERMAGARAGRHQSAVTAAQAAPTVGRAAKHPQVLPYLLADKSRYISSGMVRLGGRWPFRPSPSSMMATTRQLRQVMPGHEQEYTGVDTVQLGMPQGSPEWGWRLMLE